MGTGGLLQRLTALRLEFGAEAAAAKRRLLVELATARLSSAAAVLELHEALLFLAAFPDDPATRNAAVRLLHDFSRRLDLDRFRAALADSGLAGTEIRYPFFYPTASRLARRFPGRLAIDWASFDDPETLRPLLLAALPFEESVWVRASSSRVRTLLGRLRGSASDADALLARIDALPGDAFTREALHDADPPFYRLAPAPGTPERTTPSDPRAAIVYRCAPPDRARPELAVELHRPPREILEVRGREAERLVALARDAMVCRQRDLDCFCYGDPRDVRRIRHDDGLEQIAIGSLPERRLLLSAAYGLLTLRNGIPTGYAQIDGYLGTALVHFNTFETFRGTDAAWVFARTLAAARALFGSDAFAIEPYQLGRDNDEALASGAWWFYAKLGFAPRDSQVAALAQDEKTRLRNNKRRRSSRRTLRRLAAAHLFWEPAGRGAMVPPHIEASRAITAAIAKQGGPAAAARRALATDAARAIPFNGRLSSSERLWLQRWAPLLAELPGFEIWTSKDRQLLGELIRAKAARRESEAVPLARAHPRFGPALLELASRYRDSDD